MSYQTGASLIASLYPQPPHILVVDDLPNNRKLAAEVLSRQGYRVTLAGDGVEALERIAAEKPDLVLLDIAMPRMDGLTALRRLRSERETELLPVILVTAQSETEDKVRGLDSGASDFLPKPWEMSELLARVRAQLRVRALTSELERAEEVLFILARVVEARDTYTMEHTERVSRYALSIAAAINLGATDLKALHKGAMLHDIGKIGISDAILRKAGPLDAEEWNQMRQHPVIGVELVSSLKSLGGAMKVIRSHHERWDGKGYPDGLRDENIPHLARIVAIADAFDAMTSDRPYRKGMTYQAARHILAEGRWAAWDPLLVDVALDVLPT
ncbi:MAG: response regulator [Chloroflexi bacterium]|nr:response regulator [Chloroflexota bacterium]